MIGLGIRTSGTSKFLSLLKGPEKLRTGRLDKAGPRREIVRDSTGVDAVNEVGIGPPAKEESSEGGEGGCGGCCVVLPVDRDILGRRGEIGKREGHRGMR